MTHETIIMRSKSTNGQQIPTGCETDYQLTPGYIANIARLPSVYNLNFIR